MPEYLSPGVYVEEVDAGPKPIEGVSTSTAGAVGVTVRGPTEGKPVLVTSFADFTRTFGGFLAEPPPATVNKWALDPAEGGRFWNFPLSVKGFFDNGGQRIYVKRVFSATATASAGRAGTGLISEIEQDAAAGATSLQARHLINLSKADVVRVLNTTTGTVHAANYTVAEYDSTSRTVTFTAGIAPGVKAGRDVVVVHPVTGGTVDADTTLKFTARALGEWGQDLHARVRPVVGGTLNAVNDPGLPDTTVTGTLNGGGNPVPQGTTDLILVDATGFGGTTEVQVAGREYRVTAVDLVGKKLTIAAGLAADVSDGALVKRLRRAAVSGTSKVVVWGASSGLYPGAIVELDNTTVGTWKKETRVVGSIAGNVVTLTGGALTQDYFEGQKVRVVEAEITVRYSPDGGGETVETFTGLRLHDDGSASYLVNHVNLRSQLVRVETKAPSYSDSDLNNFPTPPNGAWFDFAGGDDQIASLSVDDFVGTDGGSGHRTGITALEDIDEISICLAPDVWSSTVQSALTTHCETLRDRFAILDPQDGLSIEGIRSFREPIDTKYAALYYPWIEVRDPSVKRNVVVGPSGHMAGIYARVDVDRGVHKAPANEVIRGITKIAQDVTKREQDLLNPKGINALRFFPGRGNRVWGARTLSSDPSWKYINVRRLFIFVEESIDEGLQWVVFEPNDEPLWARVRQTISNFLTSVWRGGALQGATAAEAFFVKVDHSTMTQDDIDNGRLIVIVGIAPVKPAEFVIIRIQQKTLEVEQS